MEKFTASDPETHSYDILSENIALLKELFPEAFSEGKIDFEVLKQLLGDEVDEQEEKYGLNWHGKRRARQLALTPSTGTLRPCPEDSVDWDTTQNLMIEGDNLEVLKLLQKSYAGKVKLIYIDPPYNTGKDFVYHDNFQDNIKNYLELTGQLVGGQRICSNTEASGRFHTDWLNMMYPRLRLARNLLREDGVFFVSIDDGELSNLRKICEEIFSEENFLVQIIWKKRSTPPNDKVIGANHDYIIAFAKNINAVTLNLRERTEEQMARYKNPDGHPKGPWTAGDLMANVKGGRYVPSLHFPIKNPETGEEHFPGENGNWRFSLETIDKLLANDEIFFGENSHGRPKLKRFLCDVKSGVTYPSIWDFVPLNTQGSSEMKQLLGSSTIFESPKPMGLIQEIIKLTTVKDSLVLDFFAGSGTTAHAVFEQNASDGGARRFICVQLPEPTPYGSTANSAGLKTISQIMVTRVTRAAQAIQKNDEVSVGDLGFSVFKLDTSNIRAWEPDRDNLDQTLHDSIEHIKSDRSEADILYELLLKLGIDLCVPIERFTVNSKEVHVVGNGVLIACLATQINREDIEPLAQGIIEWHKVLSPTSDTTCVFQDSAFSDDVTKTNLAEILKQNGISNVRSL